MRRLFDTGSFFGVGVPEAVVISLLAWFLLGPQELFRLSRQAGNWLGELRSFVGQAASQYESALDDDSTRKAIAGIRQTQQTVSEISASFRSFSDQLRDPLAITSTLESAVSKYDSAKKETPEEKSKGLPDLEMDDGEPVKIVDEDGSSGETQEELEKKRAASKEAAQDLWFTGAEADGVDDSEPVEEPEDMARRLDGRLKQLDRLATELEELRAGVLRDREGVRALLETRAEADEAAVEAAAAAVTGSAEAHESEKAEAPKVSAEAAAEARESEKAEVLSSSSPK